MSKKISIKTRLLLHDKNRILLIKQTAQNGGKYTLIGGRIERDEFAKATLVREAKEEMNIIIESKNLQLAHVLHKKDAENTRVILYFKAIVWGGTPQNLEPEKFKEVDLFNFEYLPKKLSRTAQYILKRYRNGYLYSEMEKA